MKKPAHKKKMPPLPKARSPAWRPGAVKLLSSAPPNLLAAKLKHLVRESDRLRGKHERLVAERARLFPNWRPVSKGLQVTSKEVASTLGRLQSSCDQYTNLFDFAPVGYVVLDAKGQIQEINQTGAQLLGVHRPHLTRQFLSAFVVREDYANLLSHLRQCKAGQAKVSTEMRLKQRNGPPLPVELRSAPYKNPADHFTQYRTAIIDVTQRRQTKEALEEAQQNYRALIDSIEGLVWEGKAQPGHESWRFTFVSKQAERLIGYSSQRWLLEPEFWENRLHPEDRARVMTGRAQALSKGKNHVLEYRMNDAHRRTIWVRDSVTVSTEGDQVKLRGILINISELKEMEASLRLAHSQLEVRVEHRTAALARTCIELQHEMSERKRLEQELLDLTDKGRRQQGMDVHGDVGQNLAGIAFMLKCLGVKLEQSSPSEASQAERIRSLLDQTMARTRDPAQDLVSFNRQKESLPEALESLAAQAETVFDVSCRLKRNGATAPIEPDVVAQFYNIAQEAIVNAVKFAKAGRVVIALTRKNQRLVLTVQHDGHPFPTPLHHSLELGLKIMNYRAKLIGAALRMTESGKQGRMVTCVFPAKPDVN